MTNPLEKLDDVAFTDIVGHGAQTWRRARFSAAMGACRPGLAVSA